MSTTGEGTKQENNTAFRRALGIPILPSSILVQKRHADENGIHTPAQEQRVFPNSRLFISLSLKKEGRSTGQWH